MNEVFETEICPSFGEMDPAGILYYPRFLHLCHVTMERFLEHVLEAPYAVLLSGRKLGFPTVHVEVDYHRPIVYGDTVTIRCGVAKLGRKSVVFEYRARGQDGLARADAVITTVCTSMVDFTGTPLPDDLRARFQSWMTS